MTLILTWIESLHQTRHGTDPMGGDQSGLLGAGGERPGAELTGFKGSSQHRLVKLGLVGR
jgi:hypothetical protein